MPEAPNNAGLRRFVTPDTVGAAILAASTATLYRLTLCPTVYWYDSAEFSAHAVTLGVPHPPGYPLYTMVAHLFTWLPGEPALGVNRMSLAFGVVSVVLLFALVRVLGGSLRAAVIGGATLASIRTFWANAVVAEVYTPGLVMSLGALLLLVHANRDHWRRGVLLAGLVGGLGVGMHMSIATLGIGYAWLVLAFGLPERIQPRMLRDAVGDGLGPRLKLAAGAAGMAAAGLLVFAYVPLRKFERWDAREWTIFRKNMMGGAFKRKFLQDYDLGERVDLVAGIFVDNLLVLGLMLAALGLVWLVARRRKTGIGVVLAGTGNLWWFFNYQVPDLDVFFLPCLAVGCMGVGLGVDALTASLERLRPWLAQAGWLALFLPMSLVQRNHDTVDLSEDMGAAAYGEAACDAIQGKARVLNYSSPTEWRYYSVFIYMQATQQRCAQAEIWKKPRSSDVEEALQRGEAVYAFRPLASLRARFKVTEAGPVWRIESRTTPRRRGRRGTNPPARGKPTRTNPS